MTIHSIKQQLEEAVELGGKVYTIPEYQDRFLSWAWVAVLPSGKVALKRWIPNPEEDITLAREQDYEIPRCSGLYMWKLFSLEDAAAEIEQLCEYDLDPDPSLTEVGSISMIGGKPHLDLSDPQKHTNRPEAFQVEESC